MTAEARTRRPHWMLVAAFALLPAVVLGQPQDAPSAPADETPAVVEAPQPAADTTTAVAEAPQESGAAMAMAMAATTSEPDGDARESGDGVQVISGMSILGNQEAPTSLVIVPWKSSEIGDAVGVSTILDDSRLPVDRDVFMRSLSYYQIRSEDAQ